MVKPLLRWIRSRGSALVWAVTVVVVIVVSVVAVVALVRTIEPGALSSIANHAVSHPGDALLAAGCFLGAFVIRAILWARIAPHLSIGQAWAGIMVATGANHLLPFRLGEPFRVVSVVRRTGMPVSDATSSTVGLRTGDILALLVLGGILGPAATASTLGWWGVPVVVAIVVVAAIAIRAIVIASRSGRLRRPDAITLIGTLGAWCAEAILVWRVASWAGAGLGYQDAIVVGVIAVAAQLVAITPGGVGTYEAAAITAMTAMGVPLATAAGVAVAVHLFKTILTVLGGVVAMFVPSPTMFGRFRVPADREPHVPRSAEPTADQPVVLFFPAFNEEPRIEAVIERVPGEVCGHRVECVVVDDGSTDRTVEVARAAGADVVSHAENRGLGAAVATGFRVGVERNAVAVGFCDADGEYDPAELANLVQPIVDGTADYVVGSRFAGEIEHMRPHRRFGNQVLTRWVRWMARQPITDGQSGYRVLSADAAAETVVAHDYNYAQVLTLDLEMKGFRYHEVPITYHFRTSGRSFVRLGRYLAKCVPAAWRVVNDRVDAPEPTPVLDKSSVDDDMVTEALEGDRPVG